MLEKHPALLLPHNNELGQVSVTQAVFEGPSGQILPVTSRVKTQLLDEGWIMDAGEEAAINRELEAALHDFLLRNENGIFYIKE